MASFFNDYGSHKKNNKKSNSNFKIAIVVIGAIFIGIIVYSISSLFVSRPSTSGNKTKSNEGMSIEMSIKNKQVEDLYSYVTYSTDRENNLFVSNPSVEYENFSNYDKFYYISQFITKKDFEEVEATNSSSKLYSISDGVINNYMKKFFGNSAKYDKDIVMPVVLNLTINGNNSGFLTYNKNLKSYVVDLNSNKSISNDNNSYIRKLYKATKEGASIILEEKIIYLDIIEQDNKYNYGVYKDYNHTLLIDKKESIEKDKFDKEKLLDQYLDKASIITYKFNKDDDIYYFVSSRIK